jgi:HEAT repeats
MVATPVGAAKPSVADALAAVPAAAAVTTALPLSEEAERPEVVTPAPHVAPAVVAPVVASPVSTVSAPGEDARRERVNRVAGEARKIFAGENYDESLINSDDRETRRLVGAELLSALVGRDAVRRERAREAFIKHGYFDDATRVLRLAESPNERAAAARRLSFAQNPEAAPHLIGALHDPAPEVRRTAVEALMDLRDPAAIAPLSSLLQTENDRKVPRSLIRNAIDACVTSEPAEVVTPPRPITARPAEPSSPPVETEREVIEI